MRNLSRLLIVMSCIAAFAAVASGVVFTVRERDAVERDRSARIDLATGQAATESADHRLARTGRSLSAVVARLDEARAELEIRAQQRDDAQQRTDERQRATDDLEAALASEGVKVIEQGLHLNELLLCLKAAERAFNALAGGDRATAEASLASADAACRSSSAYLQTRRSASAPAPGTTR